MAQPQYQCVNVVVTTATSSLNSNDLVQWVNESLFAQFQKIEDLSNGAAYCNFIDLLFPGVIHLDRVKFCTRQEYEKINNFKIFQDGLTGVGCNTTVPVERLVKGHFQDNFQFLQWFKTFFDANVDDHEYDALAARGGRPLGSEPETFRIEPAQSMPAPTRTHATLPLNRPAPALNTKTGTLEEKIRKLRCQKIYSSPSDNIMTPITRKLNTRHALAHGFMGRINFNDGVPEENRSSRIQEANPANSVDDECMQEEA